MQTVDRVVDFARLESKGVDADPFAHVIVPQFVRPEALEALAADFPKIDYPGSFPLKSLAYGPVFSQLIDELTGPQMTKAVESKFGIDLSDRPITVTVRGISRAADGEIHTDSTSKLITMLLYMNDAWENKEGRLRLLRSADDLSNYAAEVPPDKGTLLVFKNGPTAWHGFEKFEGPRRAIQVNWVTSKNVVRREETRHRLSAFFKRIAGRPGVAAN